LIAKQEVYLEEQVIQAAIDLPDWQVQVGVEI
jgi:hypothetical protein